jgi:hypothetical protein
MESTQGLSRSEVTSLDGYYSMCSVRHLIRPYYRLSSNHCLTRAPKHAEELRVKQKADNSSAETTVMDFTAPSCRLYVTSAHDL